MVASNCPLPSLEEDFMVFTGLPTKRDKKRLRTYVFALISNVGLSVLGGAARYVWRNF